MKKLPLLLSLIILSASAMAGGRPGWGGWADNAGFLEGGRPQGPAGTTVNVVPAGTASYSGSTIAMVTDSTSGTASHSVSTGMS